MSKGGAIEDRSDQIDFNGWAGNYLAGADPINGYSNVYFTQNAASTYSNAADLVKQGTNG